jgi:ATP-dependent helicase HepA
MVFTEGDEVVGHDGVQFVVEEVADKNGALVYRGEGHELPETGLADSLNFTKPLDRLLNAQLDDKGLFNLRSKCLHHRFETLRGHQRGFLGPRIELIPHQLFAALQVRRKGIPRIVLADESGVGKTMEACLALHRLLVTARIERAVIVVPGTLMSRWQYELTRRFHLPVTALPPEATSIPPEIPLVLCSPDQSEAAAAHAWDLLIVDEADAIESPILEALCQRTPGVILLTDLPPQTEVEAHARLQRWLEGEKVPEPPGAEVVAFAEKLLTPAPEPWTDDEHKALEELCGSPVDATTLTADQGDGRERIVAALLEAVGAGRRLLRNSRSSIEGLPEREVLVEKLTLLPDASAELCASLRHEFLADGTANPAAAIVEDDPRIAWLEAYLEGNPRDKVVLVCTTPARAAAIAGSFGEKAALYHEGLPLGVRDRAIQRFAEKDERAASLLICAESGAEGRSLPFAHHLVLFDLPPDPLKIEKRIGSLDRFGHMAKVRVHVPYVAGTPAEVYFRWFHEALHAFERPLPVVHACGRAFGPRFRNLAAGPPETWAAGLEAILPEAQQHADELKAQIEARPDRLTALASYRVLPAHRLLESLRRLDSDLSLDFLMLRLFDHFGFEAEDVGERTYHVRPREKDRNPKAFVDIGKEGQLVTFERQKALAREDLWFLTWDHPLIMRHIQLLLRASQGNSCYAVWEDMRSQIVLLEALFRVELAQPPKKLYPTRFFSPAGVRLIVNHNLEEVGAEYPMELINKNVRNGRREWIRTNAAALRRLLPRMLDDLTTRAHARAAEMKQQALADLDAHLLPELERLKLLHKRGGPASDFEIGLVQAEYDTLREVLAKPHVRLDSLRLVRRGPTGKGI